MEKSVCCSCQSPKATIECGMCHEPVCKKCTEFMDEDAFSWDSETPADLKFSSYCRLCYDAKVAPALEEYNALKKQAKEIYVFFKEDAKESRLIKRLEEPIIIKDCADREETLLRLAFLAAKRDFNVIVDVEIVDKKVRTGAYQTVMFSGTGIPSWAPPDKLNGKNKWSSVRSDGPAYRIVSQKK